MRLHEMSSGIVSLVTALTLLRPTIASIIPEFLHSLEDLQDVRKRCGNPCGYYGQVCCGNGEACYTDSNNQAQCTAAAQATTANGHWEYVTTTYFQTDLETVTQTLSTWVPAETLNCQYSLGESPCDNVCCKSGQFCESSGYCAPVGGGSSGYYSGLYTVTTVVTNTAPTAAGRPTSNAYTTVTQTGEATTTDSYINPTGTGGAIITNPEPANGGGGLSGGAIAGIVIGVIAAIIILILLCLCFCAKGILDSILALFGLGPRRRRTREEVEVYESRHHHGGSRASGRGRTWFGTKPRRSSAVEEKRKGGGWGAGASVAAFLGGLALILGIKRRRDRRHDKSSYGYGSSYYSDYTSSTESSSDRRTRRSSRSRSRSRAVSRSRASRAPSRR